MSSLLSVFATPYRTYRIYQLYNILHWQLRGPQQVITICGSALTAIGALVLTGSFNAAYVALGIFVFMGMLYLILSYLIHYVLKNTGSEGRFIFSGRHLVNQGNRLFRLNTSAVDRDRFAFATPDTADIAARLNIDAYENSIWGTSYEDKLARNSAHIRKNRYAILLAKGLDCDEQECFTHIFPVNKDTWDKYIAGGIGDNRFSDVLIVPERKVLKDQDAYGLILFSVAAAKHPKVCDEAYWARLGDYLEQLIAVHIEAYALTTFKGEKTTIPVLFQNMDISFLRFFKERSMRVAGVSKDNAWVITFEVANEGE